MLIRTRSKEIKTARTARRREERNVRLLACVPILLSPGGCSHSPACSFFVSSTSRPARSTSGTSETRLRQTSLCRTSFKLEVWGRGVCDSEGRHLRGHMSTCTQPALALRSLSHRPAKWTTYFSVESHASFTHPSPRGPSATAESRSPSGTPCSPHRRLARRTCWRSSDRACAAARHTSRVCMCSYLDTSAGRTLQRRQYRRRGAWREDRTLRLASGLGILCDTSWRYSSRQSQTYRHGIRLGCKVSLGVRPYVCRKTVIWLARPCKTLHAKWFFYMPLVDSYDV
jgi:hypothetical protein